MALMNDAPASLWLADADTGSFTFRAWGRSLHEARENLTRGVRKHARQYSLSNAWVASTVEDAWYLEIPNGGCMRDDYLL